MVLDGSVVADRAEQGEGGRRSAVNRFVRGWVAAGVVEIKMRRRAVGYE
nr:hypothetical protein [Kibdelosporangium sp. MJ126-NF4]CTQ88218.1 hypothetical protein [Kibdelosporangium sp. MJ126-NF4]